MAEYGSAFKKTKLGMVKNEVAKGEGVKLQKGDRAAPELGSKGIKAGKQPKVSMVENKVAGQGGVKLQGRENRVADLNDMGVGKLIQKSGMVVHKVR